MYTQAEYKEKVSNLAHNYKILVDLNNQGDMETFQHKLHLLRSPSDLYFEKYELIEELVTQRRMEE